MLYPHQISLLCRRPTNNAIQDATTNPSLILAAANKPGYARLIDAAVQHGKNKGGSIDDQVSAAIDRLVRSLSSTKKIAY
jgi:transaldolase